ncbi:MAG: MerR family transcriptional regulator [Hyphomicrobiaceae bacterium]
MPKAADAFRTISEVADDLGIQKHVLRFWEVKFSQIRPMKRGGGRRYYRPEDMELLRGVRQLLHRDGYTIKGVQKILREQGVEAVKERARSEEEKFLAAQSAASSATPSPTVPPAPTGSRPPPAVGSAHLRTKRGARAPGPAGSDRRSVVNAVIAELLACRDLLSSGPDAAQPSKSQRGTRRSA